MVVGGVGGGEVAAGGRGILYRPAGRDLRMDAESAANVMRNVEAEKRGIS